MLTVEELKKFIEDDAGSDKKRLAHIGQRYYEGDHDILNYRLYYYNADGNLVEDKARSNSRICHPFFTELVDQLSAFVMSFEGNPIQAKDQSNGLQEHLDTYFDDEFWDEVQELVTGANAKGFEYLYGYQNEDDRLAFMCADSLGVIEVREKDTDTGGNYVIYWYIDRIGKNKKRIKRIQVHDKDQTWFYMQEDDGAIVLDDNVDYNPRPHIVWGDPKSGTTYGDSFGFIPFWRFDNNKKQFSGLKPIKGLIDDYDLMECGLSNNLQDFDTPIHLVKGFDGDDLNELQQNIKTKKIMGVDSDGGLEVLTVDVPHEARKVKADEDEKNIYRFGMGFNSAQSGDGNITNVVIRSRYTLLELKANKLIKRLKRFLKGIIKLVLDEINAKNGTDYQYKDIEITIDPVIPTNEQEDAQIEYLKAQTRQMDTNTVLNVAAVIGDEEVLKLICEQLDLDFDELQEQLEENDPDDAMTVLEGVVTDEQAAETGSEAISE